MEKTKEAKVKLVIDLSGRSGNAFALLGLAKNLSDRLKLNTEEILQEMKSSDYENLLNTFVKYFGSYVKLLNRH